MDVDRLGPALRAPFPAGVLEIAHQLLLFPIDRDDLNVTTVAQGSDVVATALGKVAGAATETRASAQTVLEASQAVTTTIARLHAEVGDFLGKVAV